MFLTVGIHLAGGLGRGRDWTAAAQGALIAQRARDGAEGKVGRGESWAWCGLQGRPCRSPGSFQALADATLLWACFTRPSCGEAAHAEKAPGGASRRQGEHHGSGCEGQRLAWPGCQA